MRPVARAIARHAARALTNLRCAPLPDVGAMDWWKQDVELRGVDRLLVRLARGSEI